MHKDSCQSSHMVDIVHQSKENNIWNQMRVATERGFQQSYHSGNLQDNKQFKVKQFQNQMEKNDYGKLIRKIKIN